MAQYKITIKRTDPTKCEGTLKFHVDGAVSKQTKCWENPTNLIAAKLYTGCSTTIMTTKQYKSVYIPDVQTGKKGIFIHKGSKPKHSDGCIVCDKDVVNHIYDTVPCDRGNITVVVS